MLCNVSYGFQKKLSLKSKDSIIYQQKVWIVFKDAAEFSSYAFTLRSNAAKLILTNDSVHFVTKNKKLRKKHNFSIPYSKSFLLKNSITMGTFGEAPFQTE
jgi:hypothetical protein